MEIRFSLVPHTRARMEKPGLLISARNIYPIPQNNVIFRYHSCSYPPFTRGALSTKCSTSSSSIGITIPPLMELPSSDLTIFGETHQTHGASQFPNNINIPTTITDRFVLMDLDPATAKLAISLLGPFFSAFGFLFILRIIMSWYPKLPVDKFPYVIAYAPTEPILGPTRKLIPPLAGVDVTPVVWFGLISFLSEILVGPQGLLVLLSQQV